MAARGRIVMVAGATGVLGAALCQRLVQDGCRLAIAARKPWQVDKLRTAHGAQALVGLVPTGDGEAAAGFVKGAFDALGPVDAMISTAGAFDAAATGLDDAGALQAMLDANLVASAGLARALLPRLRRQRRGALVFTGSAAVGHATGMSNYLASKAALHEFVRSLAAAEAGNGIRVAAVLPRTIATPQNLAAMPDADRSGWDLPEAVIGRLLECAFGEPGPGPLYTVPRAG